MSVSPQTTLSLAPGVALRFGTSSGTVIEWGATRTPVGIHALAILETFQAPMTFQAGLARLGDRTAGMQDYMQMVATVNEMVRLGILVDAAAQPAALSQDPANFDAARVHVDMLNDRTRTASWIAAIREVVRPGDIVVDIGTGTGVLAVAAAQAGAEHVYAIEASRIATAARRVFDASGLGDRITLIEGESPNVSLPVRAQVMVAELIGLDPLAERILETTRDACTRLLNPQPRLIPSAIEVFAVPVELPAALTDDWRFTAANAARWREWYGIDFSSLTSMSEHSLVALTARPRQVHDWKALSEPVCTFSQDLAGIRDTSFSTERSLTVTRAGRADAVAIFFRVALSPNLSLSTDPRELRDDNHWNHRVWLLPAPLDVQPGERLVLTFRQRTTEPAVELRREGLTPG
jgi:hypothetical protein